MSDSNPHESFVNAWRFLEGYLERVDRLLQDARRFLETQQDDAWYPLRWSGSRMVSDLDAQPGSPEAWLPSHLVTLFAPERCFPKHGRYGVRIDGVERIAFVWAWLGPVRDDDRPELLLGWFEGFDRLEGNAESHARKLYDLLPEETDLDLTEDLAAVEWTRVPLDDQDVAAYSLALVPLSLVQGPDEVRSLMRRFHQELSTRGPGAA